MEITMTSKSSKDTLDEIISVIGEKLKENGFLQKKQEEFQASSANGNIFSYQMLISKNKGYFHLHLQLGLKNKILMGKVNSVLKRVMDDELYDYPASWDKRTIEISKKERLSNICIAMLTDWRVFRGEESLDEFNEKFNIWMCVFNDISEINNWKNQLLKSVDYASNWFLCVDSNDWIISNTYHHAALYLLKEAGDIEKLKKKYIDNLSKSQNKKEVELYFKHLNDGVGSI
jgi:hypothetical protein